MVVSPEADIISCRNHYFFGTTTLITKIHPNVLCILSTKVIMRILIGLRLVI